MSHSLPNFPLQLHPLWKSRCERSASIVRASSTPQAKCTREGHRFRALRSALETRKATCETTTGKAANECRRPVKVRAMWPASTITEQYDKSLFPTARTDLVVVLRRTALRQVQGNAPIAKHSLSREVSDAYIMLFLRL